jgi:hypothetical protein
MQHSRGNGNGLDSPPSHTRPNLGTSSPNSMLNFLFSLVMIFCDLYTVFCIPHILSPTSDRDLLLPSYLISSRDMLPLSNLQDAPLPR